MQRSLSPIAKRYLSGVAGMVGLGVIGTCAWGLHGRISTSASVPTISPAKLAPPSKAASDPVRLGPAEVGQASWYGEEFEGKRTANGERFNPDTLTCAHRTLPLGSLVRVTNLRNHRAITVRVNDRGPMLEDRMLDLSIAAAHRLGIHGIGRVSIQRIHTQSRAQQRLLEAETRHPSETPLPLHTVTVSQLHKPDFGFTRGR